MLPTQDEMAAMTRIGAALKARRRLRGLRPGVAAEAGQMSETLWRQLESGHGAMRMSALLRALRVLGLEPAPITDVVERIIQAGLHPVAVARVNISREKRGRPRKELAIDR